MSTTVPPLRRIEVDALALGELLRCVANGAPEHWLRELQATRELDALTGKANPIDTLVREYLAATAAHQELHQ